MMELVTRNYWWLGVTKDMEKYVEECDMCQRIKNRIEIPAGKLKLNEVLEKSWTHLTVNFIMATTEETSVEGLARLFRDNIWKLYGLLKSIVLDRELQFATEITKELKQRCQRHITHRQIGR